MSGHDRERLELLIAGELAPARREHTLRHLEDCEDCRSWVETYRLLGAAFETESASGHPTSEQLARYSVDPDLLTAAELRHLDDHVPSCLPCRRNAGLTREALAAARAAESPGGRARPAIVTPLRLGLAASLLALLGLVWALQPSSEPVRRTVAENRTLSQESLHGSQVIESDGTLVADSVTIEGDGDVTLRAGEVVVFGDGFSVSDGGSLRVELSTASDDRDSDTT